MTAQDALPAEVARSFGGSDNTRDVFDRVYPAFGNH